MTKCIICKGTISGALKKYKCSTCSNKCKRAYTKKIATLFEEQKYKLFNDISSKLPMSWVDINHEITKKLRLNNSLVGHLFKHFFFMNLKQYPRNRFRSGIIILYDKPADYEKAVALHRKLFNAQPPGALVKIEQNVIKKNQIVKEVIKLWKEGHSIQELAFHFNRTHETIKEMVMEGDNHD